MRSKKQIRKLWTASAMLLVLLASILFGCGEGNIQESPIAMHQLTIEDYERITLEVGDSLQLTTDAPEAAMEKLVWTSSDSCVGITQNGLITAQSAGQATVTVEYYGLTDSVYVEVVLELPADTEDGQTAAVTVPDEPSETTATPDTVTMPSSVTTRDPETDGEPIAPPDGVTTYEPETDGDTPNPTDTESEAGGEAPTEPVETLPPTVIIEAENSPVGYQPAGSYEEALERTRDGELSGYPYVPDQAPNISEYRPMEDGKYVKNNVAYYADDNTYVVVDAYGREVFRVYRGGAYISLEEVAAYVYAFGDVPANYTVSKKTKPTASVWGEYLRVNHSKFSGSTSKYPYEPELPRISGCGGDLQYYEIDIGTTGTDCDPAYPAVLYNNGYSITRGAARIVYARFDRNGNKIIEADEKFVFYTYNHYNDFQEYLNYYGGWGEMFGNITGGGAISSKYDYNPTPYVPVVNAPIAARTARILPVLYAPPATDAQTARVLDFDCRRYGYRVA